MVSANIECVADVLLFFPLEVSVYSGKREYQTGMLDPARPVHKKPRSWKELNLRFKLRDSQLTLYQLSYMFPSMPVTLSSFTVYITADTKRQLTMTVKLLVVVAETVLI
jgi:hypothetical protein